MKRYYFVSDDLKDLVLVEKELQEEGISPLQMHLVSDSNVEAERLGLHQVASLFKNDVVYSMLMGLSIGFAVSVLLVAIGLFMGVTSDRDWAILAVICLIVLGLCTWEGGLFGIQVPNRHYRRFARSIQQGRHLFFVDVGRNQADVLDRAIERHSHLKPVGRGWGEWSWWFTLRSTAYQFVRNI